MIKQTVKTSKLPASADIVIVGAGVAGLCCAYLLQDKPKRQIVIVDPHREKTR